jgi:hypothetical protein
MKIIIIMSVVNTRKQHELLFKDLQLLKCTLEVTGNAASP